MRLATYQSSGEPEDGQESPGRGEGLVGSTPVRPGLLPHLDVHAHNVVRERGGDHRLFVLAGGDVMAMGGGKRNGEKGERGRRTGCTLQATLSQPSSNTHKVRCKSIWAFNIRH